MAVKVTLYDGRIEFAHCALLQRINSDPRWLVQFVGGDCFSFDSVGQYAAKIEEITEYELLKEIYRLRGEKPQ